MVSFAKCIGLKRFQGNTRSDNGATLVDDSRDRGPLSLNDIFASVDQALISPVILILICLKSYSVLQLEKSICNCKTVYPFMNIKFMVK